MLKITQQQQEQMYRHAQRTYPEECCGILFGTFQGNRETIVTEVWETENAWEAESQRFETVSSEAADKQLTKRNRFTIDPAVLLKAQKYARTNDVSIVGIYHSHPDHPSYPSEFDRAIAWSTYSYLIMSVKEGAVIDCRSWILDEQDQFQEETIVTEGCH